jgi:hypothetical protein
MLGAAVVSMHSRFLQQRTVLLAAALTAWRHCLVRRGGVHAARAGDRARQPAAAAAAGRRAERDHYAQRARLLLLQLRGGALPWKARAARNLSSFHFRDRPPLLHTKSCCTNSVSISHFGDRLPLLHMESCLVYSCPSTQSCLPSRSSREPDAILMHAARVLRGSSAQNCDMHEWEARLHAHKQASISMQVARGAEVPRVRRV